MACCIRWAVRAVAVGVLAVVAATAAGACDDGDCGGSAEVLDNSEVEARAFDFESVTSAEPSSGSSPRCTYTHLPVADVDAILIDMMIRGVIPSDAEFYRVSCDSGVSWRTGWWRPGQPVTNDGAFHDVIQEAIDRLAPGRPVLALTPGAEHRHILGVPTWLAVTPQSWQQSSMTVTAGAASVTVTLDPRSVEFAVEDGAQYSCADGGSLFDSGVAYHQQHAACSHTFLDTPADHTGDPSRDTYRIEAHIVYDAAYSLVTPAGVSSAGLGTVAGPDVGVDVVVREYQAVRIPVP